jgi:nucleoside phosphorylase
MIHIFCALSCEAEPITQYFKLGRLKEFNLFRLYLSEDKQISLTITGIGKLNAAAAVSYHHGCLNTSISDIWLNIGVAGHANLPVGEACLINKITDNQHKTSWYPQILFKTEYTSAPLITLDIPSTDYQNELFDMEAAGFYQMALRLGTAELIHCLKIVSDNQEHPTASINAEGVKKLIAKHKTTIEQVLESLKPLAEELRSIKTAPEHYQTLIEQYHFTQSERLQLVRLLRQWTVRFPNEGIMQFVRDIKNGKTLNKKIQVKLAESDFVIHD